MKEIGKALQTVAALCMLLLLGTCVVGIIKAGSEGSNEPTAQQLPAAKTAPSEAPAADTSFTVHQRSVPVVLRLMIGGGWAIVWKSQADEVRGETFMMGRHSAARTKAVVTKLEACEVRNGTPARLIDASDQGGNVIIPDGPQAGCTGWVPAYSIAAH